MPPLRRPLVDELLEPTAIYAPLVLELAREGVLHAAAHVTGGGIVENLPRVLPEGLEADVAWGSWPEPPVFELLRARTGATEDDLRSTFNLGVGMVLVVPPDGAERRDRARGRVGRRRVPDRTRARLTGSGTGRWRGLTSRLSSACRGFPRPGETSRYRTNRPQGRFLPAERLPIPFLR